MSSRISAGPVIGLLLAAITLVVIFREWQVAAWTGAVEPFLVLAVIAIFAVQVRRARQAFVAIAAVLTLVLALSHSDWLGIVRDGLGSAAFIAAFFSALSTLRNVAQSSPALQRAGRFLSAQRPGRRYAALTVGGQMFALLLNYGAIQLLGSLALANARSEPNAEIRAHRSRRMLLAIQRAFISTLPWSPLSFAVAITTALIPGASWAQILLPGLVSSAIVAGLGWGLDTAFKPRLTVQPIPPKPEGTWATMFPLLLLLGLLVAGVAGLFMLTGVRVVGIVTVVVPAISLMWMLIQHRSDAPLQNTAQRVRDYLFTELPGFRGELTLLMMAGYIGIVGSQLLAPVVLRSGLDPAALPPWLILVSFVWLIPLAGQIGMNPILAVTLVAPLIPEAQVLGVAPAALVVAITAGWTLSGASSPFTATTLLVGTFGGVSSLHVGLRWNGVYMLLCGLVLSAWVVIFAFAF